MFLFEKDFKQSLAEVVKFELGYFIGPGFSSKYQLDPQRGLAWRNNESFCENKANKIRAGELFLVNFRVNITRPTQNTKQLVREKRTLRRISPRLFSPPQFMLT